MRACVRARARLYASVCDMHPFRNFSIPGPPLLLLLPASNSFSKSEPFHRFFFRSFRLHSVKKLSRKMFFKKRGPFNTLVPPSPLDTGSLTRDDPKSFSYFDTSLLRFDRFFLRYRFRFFITPSPLHHSYYHYHSKKKIIFQQHGKRAGEGGGTKKFSIIKLTLTDAEAAALTASGYNPLAEKSGNAGITGMAAGNVKPEASGASAV